MSALTKPRWLAREKEMNYPRLIEKCALLLELECCDKSSKTKIERDAITAGIDEIYHYLN